MSLWDELPSLEAAARRELPAADPAILALSAEDRAAVAELWASRARSEIGAGAVFAAVARGLFMEGGGAVPHELLWLASRAVCDELRHAEICRYVASLYGTETPPRAAPPTIAEPPFGRGIHAVLNSAINETIGSAFLSACLDEAEGILARAALRELLTDEMDHARLGWALLATAGLGGAMRSEVEGRVPELIHIARRAWSVRAAELPEDLPRGHGCLPRAEVLRVVEIAIREVILPGFEHLGLRARGPV
jgi:hypothetical protein